MKIGFAGNTNNYPFLLSENLKDKCEILFIVDAAKEDKLERPEYYFGNLVSYPYPSNFIEKTKLQKKINRYFPFLFSRDVIKLLNTCDVVITNEAGHYLIPFLKKKVLTISVFSGADLDVNCNWITKKNILKSKKNLLIRAITFFAFHYGQIILEKSIKRSKLISYFPIGLHPIADNIIVKCKKGILYTRFQHMHLPINKLEYTPPPNNEHIRIFNTARFNWKPPFLPGMGEPDIKKNDILIRGIAKFLGETKASLDIHFIEKGRDVDETKKLLKELNIDSYVTWHRELPHYQFIDMLKKCDIVTDHMNEHVIGGGAFGMAVGRPMISNAIPHIINPITGVETEICHAQTEEDVCEWLKKLVLDKDFRIKKGIASREYIKQYFDLKIEADFFYQFVLKELNLDS